MCSDQIIRELFNRELYQTDDTEIHHTLYKISSIRSKIALVLFRQIWLINRPIKLFSILPKMHVVHQTVLCVYLAVTQFFFICTNK